MCNKKNRTAFFCALLSTSLMIISACSNDKIVSKEETVSFEQEVLPIFQSNCAKSGCHDSQTKEKNFDLSSYTGIMANSKGIVAGDYENSKIYTSMISFGPDLMPPSPQEPIKDAQLYTIALWIKQGANNTTNTLKTITYSDISSIISSNCGSCHGGGTSVDLSNYTNLKTYATNGKLYGTISWTSGYSPMPTSAQISKVNIDKIYQWITAGCIE